MIAVVGVFLLSFVELQAQDGFSVSGVIADSISAAGLDGANVQLVTAKDLKFVAGGISAPSGKFEVSKIPAGEYRMIVSYLGYTTTFKSLKLTGDARMVNVGKIVLHKADIELAGVEVTAKFNPIIVKKDTIEFNTSAYKTKESDVVEDLLKKLPGVEVESDGTVSSGGQQVTKVYVDGKQFFGDDPKVALKNLPANAVDKVQVVDRKSDQAQFTGIEDDNTEKVINLTLRPGNRNGMFGRAMAGYGFADGFNQGHYDANGFIGYFQGSTQMTALLSSNNTNNIGFSDFMGDVMNTMGGSGRSMGGGGGNRGGGNRGGGYNLGGISLGGGNSGISTATSGGANFNKAFGANDKLKLGANYFFNVMNRDVVQESNRRNLFDSDTVFYSNQNQTQNRKSQNHRINLELDYKINENNSILFRPTVNIGAGSSTSDYYYMTQNRMLNGVIDTLSSGYSSSGSGNNSLSTSGSLLWRHKFAKVGRTLSLNVNYGYSNNQSDGTNIQDNWEYTALLASHDSLDQYYTNNNHNNNIGTRVSYTEPIGKDHFLELSYSYNRTNTGSKKETFNTVDHSKDEEYSTLYDNIYANHQADIRFNTRREKYSYTLGVGIQPWSMSSSGRSINDTTFRSLNFSPSANLVFGTTRQKMLRFDYRGNMQQASIQQLMPVKDNSNPLYEQLGNKNLNPAFRQNLRATYNLFNPDNLTTFLTSLSFTVTNNYIANSTQYDASGKQTVMPVNVNGIYGANASIMVNMPIKKTKLSINSTLAGNYGNNISYTQRANAAQEKNDTRTAGINETFRITYRNDWLELTGSYRLGYNRAEYSNKENTNYFNHRVGGDLYLQFPLGLILSSNINYNFYKGYGDNYNRDMILWGADISKQIFASKRGTVKLSVYDLLKQNSSYTRTTADNYIEDTHSNILGRFYMLSFLYRFSSFGGMSSGGTQTSDPQRDTMPRSMTRERPPMGGMGGPPQ
ncbi:MAG: outer membrane beta-barrel protein [Bacteroidales bacterium]|nr:outer membrane beta-barrel protein [Bacteroidales bacterium]